MLAGAGRSLVHDRLAHRCKQRPQGVDDFFLAADHDRQPRLFRPDVAAGDGASTACTFLALAGLGDLDRQRWLAGRHVDEHGPWPGAGERALGAQRDLAHVVRIADDRENHVGRRGNRPRRIGELGPLFHQRLGLLGRAVIDRGLVSGGDQMAAHG